MVFEYNISKIDHDSLATQVYHDISTRTERSNNEMIYIDHGLLIFRPTLETLLFDAAIFQQQQNTALLTSSSFGMMNQLPQLQQGVSLFSRANDSVLADATDKNTNTNGRSISNAFMVDQPSIGRNSHLKEIIEDALNMIAFEDNSSLLQQQ